MLICQKSFGMSRCFMTAWIKYHQRPIWNSQGYLQFRPLLQVQREGSFSISLPESIIKIVNLLFSGFAFFLWNINKDDYQSAPETEPLSLVLIILLFSLSRKCYAEKLTFAEYLHNIYITSLAFLCIYIKQVITVITQMLQFVIHLPGNKSHYKQRDLLLRRYM